VTIALQPWHKSAIHRIYHAYHAYHGGFAGLAAIALRTLGLGVVSVVTLASRSQLLGRVAESDSSTSGHHSHTASRCLPARRTLCPSQGPSPALNAAHRVTWGRTGAMLSLPVGIPSFMKEARTSEQAYRLVNGSR
jgi:hypothetical protein